MVSSGGGTFLAGGSAPAIDMSELAGFMRFPIVGALVMLALVAGPRGG